MTETKLLVLDADLHDHWRLEYEPRGARFVKSSEIVKLDDIPATVEKVWMQNKVESGWMDEIRRIRNLTSSRKVIFINSYGITELTSILKELPPKVYSKPEPVTAPLRVKRPSPTAKEVKPTPVLQVTIEGQQENALERVSQLEKQKDVLIRAGIEKEKAWQAKLVKVHQRIQELEKEGVNRKASVPTAQLETLSEEVEKLLRLNAELTRRNERLAQEAKDAHWQIGQLKLPEEIKKLKRLNQGLQHRNHALAQKAQEVNRRIRQLERENSELTRLLSDVESREEINSANEGNEKQEVVEELKRQLSCSKMTERMLSFQLKNFKEIASRQRTALARQERLPRPSDPT